jgi:general bacterial porin, GBP family
MLRPIFIKCGTHFCQAARAQSSVTLYGFLDDGIVYVNHSASDVAGRKIFQMASSSESQWGLSGCENLGGGTQPLFQLENGFNSSGGALGEGTDYWGGKSLSDSKTRMWAS